METNVKHRQNKHTIWMDGFHDLIAVEKQLIESERLYTYPTIMNDTVRGPPHAAQFTLMFSHFESPFRYGQARCV